MIYARQVLGLTVYAWCMDGNVAVIREANWLTIAEDANQDKEMGRDFDAVICCGNSFAHLPDFDGKI